MLSQAEHEKKLYTCGACILGISEMGHDARSSYENIIKLTLNVQQVSFWCLWNINQ